MNHSSWFHLEASAEPLAQTMASALMKFGLVLKSLDQRNTQGPRLIPMQGRILRALRSRLDHGLTLTALAKEMAVTPGTASVAVRILEKRGLVRKLRSKVDARFVTITPSTKGQRLAEQTANCPEFLTEAAQTFTSAEEGLFLRALMKIIRALHVRGEAPASRMCVTCRYFRPNVHRDPQQAHHCDFADAPFGDRLLRIACPVHEEATAQQRERNWNDFTIPGTCRRIT